MRWVKYLKRGCAVTLTAALLAGGANWYSLKLKAVSLSGQEGLAEPGGPNGPEGEMPLDADAQTAFRMREARRRKQASRKMAAGWKKLKYRKQMISMQMGQAERQQSHSWRKAAKQKVPFLQKQFLWKIHSGWIMMRCSKAILASFFTGTTGRCPRLWTWKNNFSF